MGQQYTGEFFAEYVNAERLYVTALLQQGAKNHSHEFMEGELAARNFWLELAGEVFEMRETHKPRHLNMLFAKLKRVEVPSRAAAEFCVMVECVRQQTHRTESHPLLGATPSGDDVLNMMRYRLERKTSPRHMDLSANTSPAIRAVQDMQRREALPIEPASRSQIVSQVFGRDGHGHDLF